MPKIKIMAINKVFRDAVQKNMWMASLGLKKARNKLDVEWVDNYTLDILKDAQAKCQLCFLVKGAPSHSAILDREQIASMSFRQVLMNY